MASISPAYARTNAPIAAGPVIVYLAKSLGWDLTVEEALLFIPIISSAYYFVARLAEAYNPKLGGILLGSAKAPAYSLAPAPSPAAGEDVVAVIVDAPEEGNK